MKMTSDKSISKYLGLDGPFVMAHRGGGKEAPENSHQAIAHSANCGIIVVESDVHATKDGVAILMHDPTVNRTTNSRGSVCDYTWQEIQQMHDLSGDCPVRLVDALEEFPNLRFNIDIKADDTLEPFIKIMAARPQDQKRMCVASFSTRRLRKVRKALPNMTFSMGGTEIVRYVLASYLPLDWGEKILKHLPGPAQNCVCVQIPDRFKGIYPVATKRVIELAHRRGQQVHVWTVNDLRRAKRLLNRPVEAIITDIPKRTLLALERWYGHNPND